MHYDDCRSLFFAAAPTDMAAVRSLDDILHLLEPNELFSEWFSLMPWQFEQLEPAVIGVERPCFLPAAWASGLDVPLYRLAEPCRQSLATVDYEILANAVAAWAALDTWRDPTFNPFDLCGFLLMVQRVCQESHELGQAVYLVRATEAEWNA